MTCPSWVALHGMAHNSIKLGKPLHHNKAVIHHITNSMDMDLGKLREIVKDGEAWHAAIHGVAKGQTRHSD